MFILLGFGQIKHVKNITERLPTYSFLQLNSHSTYVSICNYISSFFHESNMGTWTFYVGLCINHKLTFIDVGVKNDVFLSIFFPLVHVTFTFL